MYCKTRYGVLPICPAICRGGKTRIAAGLICSNGLAMAVPALLRGAFTADCNYLCGTAATAVGWGLLVYVEFCELISVPSVRLNSKLETLLPRKLTV